MKDTGEMKSWNQKRGRMQYACGGHSGTVTITTALVLTAAMFSGGGGLADRSLACEPADAGR